MHPEINSELLSRNISSEPHFSRFTYYVKLCGKFKKPNSNINAFHKWEVSNWFLILELPPRLISLKNKESMNNWNFQDLIEEK